MIREYTRAYNEVICMLLEQVQKIAEANGAALEVYDENFVTYSSVTGILENLLDYQLPVKNTFSGKCIETKQTQACANIRTNPEASIAKTTFLGLNVGSMLLLPITSQDETVKAVLKLTSEDDTFFNEDRIEEFNNKLGMFTKSISAAMLDAQTHAEKNQMLADESSKITLDRFYHQLFMNHKDFEKSLLVFDSLAKLIPQGVFIADKEGKYIYTNTSYQQIRDLTESETLDNGWYNQIHSGDLSILQSRWVNAVKMKTSFRFVFRCFDKKGKEKKILVNSSPLFKDKEFFGYIGIVTDFIFPQ